MSRRQCVGEIRDVADHARRIASDHRARSDIAYDDRAGADQRVLADDDAGQDRSVRADLGSVPDHRPRQLGLHTRRQRIFGVRQDNVGSNPAVVLEHREFRNERLCVNANTVADLD